MRLHGLASNFNQHHLDDECKKSNTKEEHILLNASEDVEASCQDTSIDLIEHLHEHECLENVGHVDQLLSSNRFFLQMWHVSIGLHLSIF